MTMTMYRFLPFLFTTFLIACAPKPKATMDNMDISPPSPLHGGNSPSSVEKTANIANTKAGTQSNSSLNSGKVPSSWDLSGAIAARSKTKSWTASVNWLQRGASSYQIRLFGPLGSGTVLVERQGGLISFRDGPKSATSSDASQLLRQQTGVSIPVNNLYYWVRGIPAPGAVQSAKRNQANQLVLLRQAGFTVEYLSYQSFGQTILPSIIKLQGNGVFMKLVIKRWKI